MVGKEDCPAVVVSNTAYCLNTLGVVRSLASEGVKVTWLTPDKSKWFYSKYCEPMLCPDFREDVPAFIAFLRKMGEQRFKHNRAVLIPTSDAALIPLSKNKSLLEDYYYPIVCDWETTEKFIDKNKTREVAESLGIPVPKTYFPESIEDAKKYSKQIQYPCLVKPISSHVFVPTFRLKLVRVNNAESLVKVFGYFFSKGFPMMLQEEIPGPDRDVITFNTVLDANSKPLAIFMHRRLIQNPPTFGVVALGESVWEPRIIEPGLKFLQAIRFKGIAQVELKQDPRTGVFKILEINGRSYLSISLATAAGMNLIYLAYKNARGDRLEPLTKYSCNYELGVRWLDSSKYAQSMVQLKLSGAMSLTDLVRPLFGSKIVHGTFSLNDPAPILMELNYVIKKVPEFTRLLNG